MVSSSRVCLPTRVRRESVSKRHKRADGGVLFFRKIFRARDTTIHSLNADLSLEHTTKLYERECYFTRAPSFSLRVVLYERGAAGLTRAFFFAKDGQTDGTDEAFADSIAVTETGGTEIDRTRSRWT